MAMDEQGRKISKQTFEEHQEKKKKKKRRREEEEREREKAVLPVSHRQEISALSSAADDAAKQKRKEKKARKLLRLQEQDASTGVDRVEEPFFDDNKKAKQASESKHSALKVGELEDQHFGAGNLHRTNDNEEEGQHLQEVKLHRDIVNEEGRMMKKKKNKKKREIQFVSAPGIQEAAESPRQANTMNSNSDMDLRQEEKDREKKREKKRKRVRFQDQISEAGEEQVTDTLDKGRSENSKETVEEVWGVRFTRQEDETLKDAIWTYIKSKGWDEQEGLNKVFNSKKHKDARNCWADINMSLPHRPRAAVQLRARILLEKGAHNGKWSIEEEELFKRLQGEHGRKWREISSFLDRHRTSLKEKWRTLKRLKRPEGKGGWTQGELQQLADMVRKSLRVSASIRVENKNRTHQHLRGALQEVSSFSITLSSCTGRQVAILLGLDVVSMAQGGKMLRAIGLVLALCLVVCGGAAEGKCVVKNKSGQTLVIVPVVEAALEVVVEVGASVVLEASQQHCYLKNKQSGHKKGPVQLGNGGVYALVDAAVVGQVNLCVASLLDGILTIGVVILGGI